MKQGGFSDFKMPCDKYKSKKQRDLCFATKEWTDWTKIKSKGKKKKK